MHCVCLRSSSAGLETKRCDALLPRASACDMLAEPRLTAGLCLCLLHSLRPFECPRLVKQYRFAKRAIIPFPGRTLRVGRFSGCLHAMNFVVAETTGISWPTCRYSRWCILRAVHYGIRLGRYTLR